MTTAPKFYQPVFGNDNFYAPDVIDITSFSPIDHMAPAAEKTDAPKTDPRKKEA